MFQQPIVLKPLECIQTPLHLPLWMILQGKEEFLVAAFSWCFEDYTHVLNVVTSPFLYAKYTDCSSEKSQTTYSEMCWLQMTQSVAESFTNRSHISIEDPYLTNVLGC